MKITDEGLERVLSLGMLKATKLPGVYSLYEWKGSVYYCGLDLSKEYFKDNGLFITLTEEQFKRLPIATNKPSTNSKLIKITELFETAIHFELDTNNNRLKVKDLYGKNSSVKGLLIDLNSPSPFKIVQETLKEFHGFYSNLSPCSESLKASNFNVSNLWMTIHPIKKDGVFDGLVVGISEGKDYGLDSLKLFKDYEESLKAS